MKKNVTVPAKKFATFLLIPVLAVFLGAFAQPDYPVSDSQEDEVTTVNDSVLVPAPLILLDGVAISYGDLQKIDPEKLETVEVLKDKQAIEVYGEKGKNGVIIITTKKD
jgi:TonB-dependent SusC/RagA subfamily outer membrane receptor